MKRNTTKMMLTFDLVNPSLNIYKVADNENAKDFSISKKERVLIQLFNQKPMDKVLYTFKNNHWVEVLIIRTEKQGEYMIRSVNDKDENLINGSTLICYKYINSRKIA